MIHTVRVGRNGRVTIPVAIRRALNLTEGDRVLIERSDGEVVIRRAISVAERTSGLLALYRHTTPLSLEDERAAFERAVADEVSEQS